MLTTRLIICAALFTSLLGCQLVKPDQDNIGAETNANDDQTLSSGKKINSEQLLFDISQQTSIVLGPVDETVAQQSLENNFTHQPRKWKIATGELVITPIKTYQLKPGLYCRDYKTKFVSSSSEVSVKSSACRQNNGVWLRQK